MDALEPKYRDYELAYAAPGGEVLREREPTRRFLMDAFASVGALTRNVNRLFDPTAMERAFGAPGEPEDVERIEHLAKRIIAVYSGLLDWAARVRSALLSEEYDRAKELAVLFVAGPIEQFRDFVQDVVSETDSVPARLAKDEDVKLEFALVLSIDKGVQGDFQDAVDDMPRFTA